MPIKKRITIKQVASEASVSTQTVSRVINNRPDVAPETRQRVEEVVERLGYHPSALARSLIQQHSYTLGVVTAGLKYIGPSRTLNGIAQQTEAMGYSLLLKELPRFDANDFEPLLQSLLARQVDGVIWAVPQIGANRYWLKEHVPHLPIPIMFLTMEPQPGISIVSIDNYQGGRLATKHLLEQGYRRIGHISGPLDWWEARERKRAWENTLLEAGLPVEECQSVEGNWSSSSSDRAFRQLLDQFPGLDAVFVGNDQMALSVYAIASARGIRIPQDLGVVGFDGIPESAYYWPALTTIDQNQHELGCNAISELVYMIETSEHGKKEVEPRVIILQPELIIRESSPRRPI